jgi:hypothetical protein
MHDAALKHCNCDHCPWALASKASTAVLTPSTGSIATTWLVHVIPPSAVDSIDCTVPTGNGPDGELFGARRNPTEHTETLEQDNAVSALPAEGIVSDVQLVPPSVVL